LGTVRTRTPCPMAPNDAGLLVLDGEGHRPQDADAAAGAHQALGPDQVSPFIMAL